MPLRGRNLQVYAAVSCSLGCMIGGLAIGYTATALPNLQPNMTINPNFTGLTVTDNQASWIGSVEAIGSLIGNLLIGTILYFAGRRMTFIFIAPIGYIIGWLMQAAAQNVAMLYIGRLIVGIFFGVSVPGQPIYVMETADVDIRGSLASLLQVMVTVGILISYIIGKYVDWMYLAGASMILCLPYMITMAWSPESPYWLVEKGRTQEALIVLTRLKGSVEVAKEELARIEEERRLHAEEEASAGNEGFKAILQPAILKSMFAACGLFIIQQWCGVNAVLFYTVQIFNDAHSTIESTNASIIVGVVQLLATLVGTVLVEKTGRKILLFVSSAGMSLSLVALGTYFYYQEVLNNAGDLGWLPLVSLMVYITAFSLGYGPIPWVMATEIIPDHVRTKFNPIAVAVNSTCVFLVTYTFNDMINGLDLYGTFWFYAAVCALAVFFGIFCLPETKGKSVEEIQVFFGGTIQAELDAQKHNISKEPTAPPEISYVHDF